MGELDLSADAGRELYARGGGRSWLSWRIHRALYLADLVLGASDHRVALPAGSSVDRCKPVGLWICAFAEAESSIIKASLWARPLTISACG